MGSSPIKKRTESRYVPKFHNSSESKVKTPNLDKEKQEFKSKLRQPTRLSKMMKGYYSDAALDTGSTFVTDSKGQI